MNKIFNYFKKEKFGVGMGQLQNTHNKLTLTHHFSGHKEKYFKPKKELFFAAVL